jgi:hypothetical protein
MDSMVTIAQVKFTISNWRFADQNFPIELFINFVKLWQHEIIIIFVVAFILFLKKVLLSMTYSTN